MMNSIDPLEESLRSRLERLKDVPGRNLVAAAEARSRYMEEVRQLSPNAAQGTHPRQAEPALQALFSALFGKSGFFSLGRVVILVLVIFFSSGAATVFASQSSLPGQNLYPVKVFSENALLTITISPEKRLDLTLQLTDRRVREIAALQNEGQAVPQMVLDLYDHELDQSLHLAADLNEPQMLQSLQDVSRHADEQLKAVQGLANGNKSQQALQQMQERLEQQMTEAQKGQSDPQVFRQNFQNKKNDHGKPHDGETPGQTPTPSLVEGTPTPTPQHTPPGHEKASPTPEASSTETKKGPSALQEPPGRNGG